ncbi:MAG: serine/threonine-protein kinase [Nannocystaceae bacterium]
MREDQQRGELGIKSTVKVAAGRLVEPTARLDAAGRVVDGADDAGDPDREAIREAGELLRGDDSAGDRALRGAVRGRLFGGSSEPTHIGRYLIGRRLGAGGMGVVYSAYDPELDRRVALKLLHADRSGPEARARILREAQAIARISHPNIVHVYEVNEHADQVFMAMEFAPGETIDEWIHRRPRSWREVLGAYLQVAEGLRAAHEVGLVHRDIKPENVVMGEKGRVMILDFGLARLREADAARTTRDESGAEARITGGRAVDEASGGGDLRHTLTATGAVMGTPAYMSPEQCSGLPADARSDQFSFCVALYEGLYGERPFAAHNLSELIAAICGGKIREAPRGSKVPTWLRRVLLRGLSVKTEERWPSMQALAEALAADPARSRTRWLGGAAIVGSLALGVVGVWRPLGDAGICRGEGHFAGVWDGARKEQVRGALARTGIAYADQSWALIERSLDAYVSQWSSMYADACQSHRRGDSSADLYDREIACLDARVLEVSAMVDVLAAADAQVLQHTSELLGGLAPVASCGDTESLRERYAPPPDQKTADAVKALRRDLIDIRIRTEAGHAIEASENAAATVRAAQALGYKPLIAEAHLQLAYVRTQLYQPRQAQESLLEALLVADAARHDEVAAEAGAFLVFMLARAGHHQEAMIRAQHVKAVIERLGRPSVADVNLQRGIATVDFILARFQEARAGLEEALAIAESLPDGQGEKLATLIHVNIGQVCEIQGDLRCVSASFERAMSRIASRLGEGDPKLGLYQYMLAKARVYQGRAEEATTLVEAAVDNARRAFGTRHNWYGMALWRAAEVMMLQGELRRAHELSEEATEVSRAVFGDEHADTMWMIALHGEILRQEGRYEEALTNLERAEAIRERLASDEAEVRTLLTFHAALLLDMDRFEEARGLYQRLIVAVEGKLGADHPDLAVGYTGLARANIGLGGPARLAEAREQLTRARAFITAIAVDHWGLIEPLTAEAELDLAEGRPGDAVKAAEEGLRIVERFPCMRIERARLRGLLARALDEDHRDPERALSVARLALADQRSVDGAPTSKINALEAWIAARTG